MTAVPAPAYDLYEHLAPADRMRQIRELRPFMNGPYMDGLGLGPWNPYSFWRNHGILAIPGIGDLPLTARLDRAQARRQIAREDWKARCERKRKVTARFRRIIIEQAGRRCEYCGRRLADAEIEIDHIVPVTRGGGGSLSNLACSCKDCNRSKSDYLIEEWLDGHYDRIWEAVWKFMREVYPDWASSGT
jgi:hypothetical protein